jgi:hypothetical protein
MRATEETDVGAAIVGTMEVEAMTSMVRREKLARISNDYEEGSGLVGDQL